VFEVYDGTGYAVGMTPRQHRVERDDVSGFYRVILDVIREFNPYYVGTWVNPDDGLIYIDPIAILDDLEDAIALGVENNQIAIFNLDTMEEIRL
jgi:hypothetical protein